MNGKSNEWFDWIKIIGIALIVAFVIRTFFVSPIVVDGPSMEPTLQDRDQMIVNKFIYRIGDPNRFDIVVFHATDEKDFIKRVIGLPGEHVAVKDNELYINGERVEEDYLEGPVNIYTNDFRLEDLPGHYERIPEGHVFVLGDNRSNSTDSRSLGVISIDEIVGKASLIYWPLNRIGFVK